VPPLLEREVVDVVMEMEGAAPSTVTSKTFDLVMDNNYPEPLEKVFEKRNP